MTHQPALIQYTGELVHKPELRVRLDKEGRAQDVLCLSVRVDETGHRLDVQQAIPEHTVNTTRLWASTLRAGQLIALDVPRVSLTLKASDVARITLTEPVHPHHYLGACPA